MFLFDTFKASIQATSFRSRCPIPPMLKLTTYLLYLRSNGYYRSVATQLCVQLPVSTIEMIVNQMSRIVASYRSTFVPLPTIEDMNESATFFLENFDFPGVHGIIGMFQIRYQQFMVTNT